MTAADLRRARRDLWAGLALCLLLTLFIDIAVLVVPIFDMQLYDRVIESRNMDTLLLLAVVCGTGLAIYGVLDLLRSAALLAIADALARRLRLPLLGRAVGLGLVGDKGAAAQVLRDIEELRGFLASGAVCTPLDALCAPVLLAVLFMLHPAYGFLGIGGAALLVLLSLAADLLARPGLMAATADQQRVAADLAEHLRDVEVSEGLGMLPAIARRWLARQGAVLARLRQTQDRGQLLAGVSKMTRLALSAGVMVLGASMILARATTPGSLMGANLLLNKMLGPFDHLVASWRHWALALAAWRRIRRLDPAAPAPAAWVGPAPGPPGLLLRDVAFTLPGQARPLLAGLTLAVASGQALGVVGVNGAGKSTLLRLLAGLLAPSEGVILLDGVPLAAGPGIGYLPQGVALLDGSVGANIARFTGADGEHPEDTIRAARQAGVHDLIGRLRQGYATELGADGTALSGGQRQRIGLARALFGAPRLLVLDEPDASLDHDGDRALLAALHAARAQGSVVVLTTHRPRLLDAMDLILEVHEGRMRAFGPPPATAAEVPASRVARMQPA